MQEITSPTKPTSDYNQNKNSEGIKMDFQRHLKIVESCRNEGDLHSNWFSIIANEFFDAANKEIQHEKRGPKGVVDVAIHKKQRCQLAVELKNPHKAVKEPLESSFEQAHRYSSCFLNPRGGLTVFPLGLLTDGYTAIVFDSSLESNHSKASMEFLILTKEIDFNRFINIFQNIQNGKTGHQNLHRPPIIDTRTEGVLDVRLKSKCKEILNHLISDIKDDNLAFDYWVQLFLIAVLRDHGIVPNYVLQEYKNNNNVKGITEELNRLLNENFIPLDPKYSESVWYVYGQYGFFPTRLNLLSSDTLGFAYESVLHDISHQLNKTSVYTPEDLAIEMISRLTPTKEDVIADVAAGTGTLLCVASEIAWKGFDYEKEPISQLSSFFENNIIAIDRDPYAIKCCKAMLLGSYVKILNIEPADLGSTWVLPKIKNTYQQDLFTLKIDKKVSLLVGNPPWGNIDGPNNPTGITQTTRSYFKKDHANIYKDDSDIGIYVVKQCIEEKIFKKDKTFRCGLLIKQQILTNKANVPFMKWANQNSISFIDHGHEKRFSHSPASLVAECLIGVKSAVIQSTSQDIPLLQYIIPANGFQPTKHKIYLELAEQNPGHVNNKILYPNKKNNSTFLIWRQEDSDDIFFVKNGTDFPLDTNITQEQQNILSGRCGVAPNFPYSWRGTEKIEYYGKDLSTPRLFMPRSPAKNERVACGIDLLGEGIGTGGQSIWLKKETCDLKDFVCICAWVNSSDFERAMLDAKVTLRSHGYNLNPSDVAKIKVPIRIFSDDLFKLATTIIENRYCSDEDLKQLDDICKEQKVPQELPESA